MAPPDESRTRPLSAAVVAGAGSPAGTAAASMKATSNDECNDMNALLRPCGRDCRRLDCDEGAGDQRGFAVEGEEGARKLLGRPYFTLSSPARYTSTDTRGTR